MSVEKKSARKKERQEQKIREVHVIEDKLVPDTVAIEIRPQRAWQTGTRLAHSRAKTKVTPNQRNQSFYFFGATIELTQERPQVDPCCHRYREYPVAKAPPTPLPAVAGTRDAGTACKQKERCPEEGE